MHMRMSICARIREWRVTHELCLVKGKLPNEALDTGTLKEHNLLDFLSHQLCKSKCSDRYDMTDAAL